jgi:hypothetical protein
MRELERTTFEVVGLRERRDIQRFLRERIEVIAPDTLVIAEEFGEWDESRRRIDLLAIDKSADLVVIELKRTDDGGHMDLQAIRYASMVSTMTFDHATNAFRRYLQNMGREDQDPRETILEFLGWDQPEDRFAQNVRIVLASAEFSKELTTTVLWLNDQGIDIRCVRLQPYRLENRTLVDAQQVIPLPEVAEYQVQVREKIQEERQARARTTDFTRYDVKIGNEVHVAMWKRNAIFLICRTLCERGINPDEIGNLFDWRANRVWYSVNAAPDAPAFIAIAAAKAEGGGPAFDHTRWFCAGDQLVRANGKTYAFSKQWGGDGWHRAMSLIKEKYPQFGIEYNPAS